MTLARLPASSSASSSRSASMRRSTSERLAAFHQVENTYLSTFQALGGLGLLLGTVGLATVMFRNVLERRRELGLLRAVGYDTRRMTLMIVAEAAFLLGVGMVAGIGCAAIAIAPAWLGRGGTLPGAGPDAAARRGRRGRRRVVGDRDARGAQRADARRTAGGVSDRRSFGVKSCPAQDSSQHEQEITRQSLETQELAIGSCCVHLVRSVSLRARNTQWLLARNERKMHPMNDRRRICLARLLGVVLCAALASAQDWPQWRGPARTGAAVGFTPPAAWPDRPKQIWKVQAGIGHASPIVAAGRVFLFSRTGEQEAVSARDLATGKEIWRAAYDAPYQMNPAATTHGKGPKSTPAHDRGRLFTFGIGGILSAWQAQDGRLLWRRDFKKEFPTTSPDFGVAMSPIVVGRCS